MEAKADNIVGDIIQKIVNVHNGILKVVRVCDDVEGLAAHGVKVSPDTEGLLEEQIAELKLVDREGERCVPTGGIKNNPDPLQKRNGKAPVDAEVLTKTVAEARNKISKDNVKANVCVTWAIVKEALDILKGAVAIVYPMGLPEYDPIRMELENREEIRGSNEAIDVDEATLWFANKEMKREDALFKYSGKNEKTKLIVKLSTQRRGQPTSESFISPETQKKLALENYKRMEELKRLEKDVDDSYLNSNWADGQALRRKFQGLNNISWKP